MARRSTALAALHAIEAHSDVAGTDHPRILRANERLLSFEAISNLVGELQEASAELDYDRARGLLSSAIEGYSPAKGLAFIYLAPDHP